MHLVSSPRSRLSPAASDRSLQLSERPGHLKALFTRAACYMRKKMYAKAIEDYSVVRVCPCARVVGRPRMAARRGGCLQSHATQGSSTPPLLTPLALHSHPPPQLLTNFSFASHGPTAGPLAAASGGGSGASAAGAGGGSAGKAGVMGPYEAAAAYWHRGTAYDRLGYTNEAIAGERRVAQGGGGGSLWLVARGGSVPPCSPPAILPAPPDRASPTPSRARADFTRVLELDPPNFNAAYARAAAYNRKGAFAEAIDDYNLALAKDAAATAVRRAAVGGHGGAAGGSGDGSAAADALAGLLLRGGFAGGPASGSSSSSSSVLGLSDRPTAGFGLGLQSLAPSAGGGGGGSGYGGFTGGPSSASLESGGGHLSSSSSPDGAHGSSSANSSAASASSALPPSRALHRKGSFAVGVDSYLRAKEAEVRERLRGSGSGAPGGLALPLPSPSMGPASLGSARSGAGATSGGGSGVHVPPLMSLAGPVSATGADGAVGFRPGAAAPAAAGPPRYPTSSPSPPASGAAAADVTSGTGRRSGGGSAGSPPDSPSRPTGSSGGSGHEPAPPSTAFLPRTASSGALPASSALNTSVGGGGGSAADAGAPSSSSAASPEADVHHARGFALRRKGDFAGAIAEYTRAIALDPGHFKAYFNRCVPVRGSGSSSGAGGRAGRRVSLVCSLPRLPPCVPTASSPPHCSGFAHDKLRDFPSAIGDYTRALGIDPRNAYAFYNRGISHDRSGDYAAAIADFTAAIGLLPTNADFHHNRGFCHRKRGDFGAAVADYTTALSIDPRHFKAVYNRAFSYDKVRLGEGERQTPGYARKRRAVALHGCSLHSTLPSPHPPQMGRLEEALADYTTAVELEPRNANAYHNRGSTLDKVS
jgi:tetratricopeptide (TPR) repeat protein